MNRIKKIISSMILIVAFVITLNVTYAASATIKAAKTTATVGEKVKVTVTVKAGAWNLKVSGSASGDIIGFNMDGENQTTTKTYTISCSKVGTYTVKLAGDITDGATDKNSIINKSVTITVKEKTTTNNNTTTTKSSNCNLSKITLSVEGLRFKSSQTTYNINVGADVDNITVKATTSHSKATYSVSGNTNLKAGNNVIKIVVKAEDGTKKTYKINVEKAGDIEETSSALTNLIIEDMTFEEVFEKTVTEYVGKTIEYTEKLNVLAYTEAENATYEIIGADNLKVGKNEVIVRVTSSDETTTTDYTVTFEMLPKEEENALQTVGPNVTNTHTPGDNEMTFWEKIQANGLLILVYLLAIVEFIQVIYLYVKLEKAKAELQAKNTRTGAKEIN